MIDGAAQPFALGALTIVSTVAGGLFALRARRHIDYVLCFTTGVVFGVVALDLIPELAKLASGAGDGLFRPMAAAVVAFLLFRSFEQLIVLHDTGGPNELTLPGEPIPSTDGARRYRPERQQVGMLAAVALIGHSAFDGVSIGMAFHVTPALGLTVAIAVIAHDFADGINTVSLMMVHGNSSRRAAIMLVLDAIAPLAGVTLTFLTRVPPSYLVLFLGFFAGFLLHVATSGAHGDRHAGSFRHRWACIGLTWVGAAFAYVTTRAAG